MKILKFEGAGAVPRADLENCRIRTTFENDKGELIYIEMLGHPRHSQSPLHIENIHGFISHCFYMKDYDAHHSKELKHIEKMAFEYNRENILKLINKELGCSFDSIEVLNEGYDGFLDQDQKPVKQRLPRYFRSELSKI